MKNKGKSKANKQTKTQNHESKNINHRSHQSHFHRPIFKISKMSITKIRHKDKQIQLPEVCRVL